MSSTILDFTLQDSQGDSHEYTLRQHPTDAGLLVVDALISAGLGAAVELIFGSISVPENFDKMEGNARSDVMLAMSEKMDRELLVGQFLDGLQRAGGISKLAPMLLKYAHRDGKPLSDNVTFASSYQGNYGEMIAAARKAVDHNAFLGLFSMSFT
jgi:hypothetical protein